MKPLMHIFLIALQMARPVLTDEQRQTTRRKIRDAASKLYVEKGLADISARAVAEKAGVSVGTIYAHFGNLTALMQSLWKEPLSRLLEDLEKVLGGNKSPIAKLEILLETYADFATSHIGIYRGAFLYIRPESHKQPAKVSLEEDRLFCLFRDTVIEGQQQGLVRKGDPNMLAQTLWGGLHGAIALPQNVDRLALAKQEETLPFMIKALLEWISVK